MTYPLQYIVQEMTFGYNQWKIQPFSIRDNFLSLLLYGKPYKYYSGHYS